MKERMENIISQTKLINKQLDLMRYESTMNKELELLAEYKEMYEEALLIGNDELITAIRKRITILETILEAILEPSDSIL